MKKAILFLVILLFVAPVVQGDEIRAHVDANGNVTYTNSGPTLHEQQQRETAIESEKSKIIATEIADRHSELIADPNLSETLFHTVKKYVAQGNSPSNSLLLAEDEMISQEYLRDEEAIRKKEQEQVINDKQKQVELERQLLEARWASAIERCAHGTATCKDETNKRFKKRIADLKSNPDLYFYKEGHKKEKSGRFYDTDDIGSRNKDQRRISEEDNKPQTRFDDRTGHVQQRGAGGYIDTTNGTFHQDAAGGTINTRTGEFTSSK